MDLDIENWYMEGLKEIHTKITQCSRGLLFNTCNLPVVYKMGLIINYPIANDKWCMAENGKMLYYSQKHSCAYYALRLINLNGA